MTLSDKISMGSLIVSVSAFFVSIYSSYLQKKLLHFNTENRLDPSYKELNLVMIHMIKDCAYFAYAKHDFYDELCEKTKNLEEKMINLAGKIEYSRDEQVKTIYSLHQDLMDIVKFINRNYIKA